jgi:predicted porin
LYLGTSFADATIYGTFDQAYRSDKTTIGTAAANTKKGVDSVLNGGMAIGFKGSEDLGGGLTASFVAEIGFEPSDPYTSYSSGTAAGLTTGAAVTTTPSFSNGVNNRQSFVGLAGGFGSVNIGRQYSNIFMAACGNDVGGCAAMVGNLAILTASDASQDVRRANQVNYSLPSFVPGLTIQVGKSFGEKVSVGANTTNNAGDGSNYTFGYSTSGISATYASETVDNTGQFSGYINAQGASTTSKRKTNVMALSYDAGMVKLHFTNTKSSIGTGVSKATMYGVSAPLGSSASIGFEMGTGDTKSIASTTTSKLKGSQLAFNYSLSKRTIAYFRQGSTSETTAAGINAGKASTTAFGVSHNF